MKNRYESLLVAAAGLGILFAAKKGWIDLPPDQTGNIVLGVLVSLGMIRGSATIAASQLLKSDIENPDTPTNLSTLNLTAVATNIIKKN